MSKYSVVHIYGNCFKCKLVPRNEIRVLYHLFKHFRQLLLPNDELALKIHEMQFEQF